MKERLTELPTWIYALREANDDWEMLKVIDAPGNPNELANLLGGLMSSLTAAHDIGYEKGLRVASTCHPDVFKARVKKIADMVHPYMRDGDPHTRSEAEAFAESVLEVANNGSPIYASVLAPREP